MIARHFFVRSYDSRQHGRCRRCVHLMRGGALPGTFLVFPDLRLESVALRSSPVALPRQAVLPARRPAVTLPAIPERIGNYPILRELGHGATSRVFLARDPFADRQVAIKIMHKDRATDAVMRHRFDPVFL